MLLLQLLSEQKLLSVFGFIYLGTLLGVIVDTHAVVVFLLLFFPVPV